MLSIAEATRRRRVRSDLVAQPVPRSRCLAKAGAAFELFLAPAWIRLDAFARADYFPANSTIAACCLQGEYDADMDVAMKMWRRDLLFVCTLILLGSGCAQWSSAPPSVEQASLPLPKLAPDNVVFEVTFVRIPEDEKDFADRFWPEVDETALPIELRRRLTSNGFRCGLVGSPVPVPLQEILDQQLIADPGGGDQDIGAGAGNQRAYAPHAQSVRKPGKNPPPQ